MRSASFILGLFAACLASTSLWAESVPPQLRNKSITASWTMQRSVMTPRGERQSPSISVSRLIYVSGNGRFFVKATINTHSAEVAPGEKTPHGGARDMMFSGGKIVGTAQRGAGAGRMMISFDQTYSSCSVHVMYGKPPGQRVMITNRRGVRVELLGVTYSGQSCSIRDGNAFSN